MYFVECLSDTRDKLGESTIWIEEENSIYWVDIKRFLIHKVDILNNHKSSWTFRESIGCIAYINENQISLVIDKKNMIGGLNKYDITNLIVDKLNKELPSIKLE